MIDLEQGQNALIQAIANDDRVVAILTDPDFFPPDEYDIADLVRAFLAALVVVSNDE